MPNATQDVNTTPHWWLDVAGFTPGTKVRCGGCGDTRYPGIQGLPPVDGCPQSLDEDIACDNHDVLLTATGDCPTCVTQWAEA